jgi:hypothetical protein
MPVCDISVFLWADRYAAKNGLNPKVSDLPEKLQIALGKKVFEFADYRDEFWPQINDLDLYEGCLSSHHVRRSLVDAFNARWIGRQTAF